MELSNIYISAKPDWDRIETELRISATLDAARKILVLKINGNEVNPPESVSGIAVQFSDTKMRRAMDDHFFNYLTKLYRRG